MKKDNVRLVFLENKQKSNNLLSQEEFNEIISRRKQRSLPELLQQRKSAKSF